jgi:nitroimidazol reductase NimA-like FMN-containing flavoprotein (pyridoxamine 5'-phosphate oxidase superfamily)
VTIERRSRRYSSAQIERLVRQLMNAAPLCALATASSGGRPHINHMYFAWRGPFEVVWVSDPDSRHSRNLLAKPSAAVTIYDSHQIWGRPDRGIQLFGTAGAVTGSAAKEAERAYSARFAAYDPSGDDDAYPFYRFRPREVKLFYERILGAGTLVSAKVTREGLAWARTEVFT